MLSYRYRIKERDVEQLDSLIVSSNCIWNYALKLQQKSYEWYGRYIPLKKLKQFIAKKRKKSPYWLKVNAQSVQEIIERLDTSYQRFFKKKQKRPPKRKDMHDDGSLCFWQNGFKIDNDRITITDPKNRNRPLAVYRFLKHRAYPLDNVKSVRIKRYNNRYFVIITCDCQPNKLARNCNGTAGIDFGLKTFITLSDGTKIESPRFLFRNRKKLRKLSNVVSRRRKWTKEQPGSNRRKKAVRKLANFHAKVAQQREDWQWKLAHQLCKQYSVIKIEDLNIKGWVALWDARRPILPLVHLL